MDDEYVDALKGLIMTFLNLSDEWLEKDIINQETHLKITKEKKAFTGETDEIKKKQG